MPRNHTALARLRDANPHRSERLSDERLKDHIVSLDTNWEAHSLAVAGERGDRVTPKFRPKPQLVIVAVALALTLMASGLLSGSDSRIAQAFPVLQSSTELTPAALQQSPALKTYGFGPETARSFDIEAGHPVKTPWGTGYVLQSSQGLLCIVAPGLNSVDWGGSCASDDIAAAEGTRLTAYAREDAKGEARVLALLPRGASATIRAGEGAAHEVDVRDGVLATLITSPVQIVITTDSATRSYQVSPRTALKAADPENAPAALDGVGEATAGGG